MPSLLWTYTTLTAALQAWPEDDNSEYTTNLDSIIGLGETKLLRDLDLELFDTTATFAFTASSGQLAKPSGILAPRTLSYTDSGGGFNYLHPRSYEYVLDYQANAQSGELPKYYAELNDTTWLIAPLPVSAFAGTVRYIKRPQGLKDVGGSNTTWLSTNAADALLYACIIAAEEYLKGDERWQQWNTKYGQDILPAAKRELARLVRTDYARG